MQVGSSHHKGRRLWIWAMVAVSSLVTMRYLYWRVTETLNFDALWFSIPLLAAEIHGFIEVSLYFFMTWNPTRRTSPQPLQGKSVDILIPTYNESVDILRMTLLGCRDIKYPHTTFVCDDGGRPEVKALAEEFGCKYITRAGREHAKAGNLNNALKHSTAEFIVTLDADHVPLPTLVDETIGFFADEKVALVQMPQDFYNLDSFQHMTEWNRHYSWHEQELFYSVIQPGKDRWNAAFYCGSTTIIRRKALDEVGGFATETVTEDIHTALRLQGKGWHSVYYNKTMARGIAPDDLYGFSLQRLRWGEGAMQVFKIDNPLTMKGLTLQQRLSYFASMYTYFDGFQKLIYVLTPIIILLTNILPIDTDGYTFAKYFIPYFVISVYAMSLSQGGFKSMVRIEQYNLIKIFNQIKAVILGFFSKVTYQVTPKDAEARRNLMDVVPQVVLGVLSFAAILIGAWKISSGFRENLWAHVVSIMWAFFYISLIVPIAITALSKKARRKFYRFDGRYDVTAKYSLNEYAPEGIYTDVGYARNITPYGFSITTDVKFPIGKEINIQLCLPDDMCIGSRGTVRWVHELKLHGGKHKYMNGIEFKDLARLERDAVSKFLLEVAAKRQAEYLKLSSRMRIREDGA